MAAVLASLSIFCSLTASVSLRFCRNSARERRKRATLLGPSMLGVLKAVRERAWCTRACGRLRAVHKRLIRGRRACSYLLHDLPSVARRPYSAHAQQLSIESQRARHRAQAATSAPRARRLERSRSPPPTARSRPHGGETTTSEGRWRGPGVINDGSMPRACARFLPEFNRHSSHSHDDCLRTVYTRTTSSLPASSNKSCAIHAMEPGKQSLKSSEPLHTATHWWSMMPGCSLSAAFSSARDRSLTLNGEDEAKVRVRASGCGSTCATARP